MELVVDKERTFRDIDSLGEAIAKRASSEIDFVSSLGQVTLDPTTGKVETTEGEFSITRDGLKQWCNKLHIPAAYALDVTDDLLDDNIKKRTERYSGPSRLEARVRVGIPPS